MTETILLPAPGEIAPGSASGGTLVQYTVPVRCCPAIAHV